MGFAWSLLCVSGHNFNNELGVLEVSEVDVDIDVLFVLRQDIYVVVIVDSVVQKHLVEGI